MFDILLEHGFNTKKIKEKELHIPNIHYSYKNKVVGGDLVSRLSNLDEIPSPYLSGLMNKFFDKKLIPLLQTARGCPFQCTYCQEGQPYFNKPSRFSIQRIRDEFDYIAQRAKVPNLIIVDSNFGMYKEDVEICKHLISKGRCSKLKVYFARTIFF